VGVGIHTEHSIAEHNRVLEHLLRRGLDGGELALPGLLAPAPFYSRRFSPVRVLRIGRLYTALVSWTLAESDSEHALFDMPTRVVRLCGVLGVLA
jgi:hypothetical protein